LELILSVDIGTGSCRSVLYDRELARHGMAAVEYATRYPQPDWAEQDPEAIYQAVLQAVSQALADSGCDPAEVRALTLDSALHSFVGLDADGAAVTPCLTWADTRARHLVAEWQRSGFAADAYARTGCPRHPLYPLAKTVWFRKQAPDLFARIQTVASIKSYVMLRLTGRLVEDRATASGSGLLDIHSLDWDDVTLALAGLERAHLPELVAPEYVIPGLTAEAARYTRLPSKLEVVAGSSDAATSSLGSGTVRPDQMTIMVGTSGAVRRLDTRPVLDPQGRTFCYYAGQGLWFAGGAINNGGNVLRWFRDHFGEQAAGEARARGVSTYAVLCEKAQEVPAGADGLLFLPFMAGERSPHWNSSLRGTLFGLSLRHGQAHLVRALLESVCYSIRSVVEPLEKLTGAAAEIRVTGGFTRSALWLQILADVLGRALAVTYEPEGSALGAAALALRALGLIDSLEGLVQKNPVREIVRPETTAHTFYDMQFARYLALYEKIKDAY
jgi:gluconokinase